MLAIPGSLGRMEPRSGIPFGGFVLDRAPLATVSRVDFCRWPGWYPGLALDAARLGRAMMVQPWPAWSECLQPCR